MWHQFIDSVTAKYTPEALWQDYRSERRAVESSPEFFCSGSLAYFLKLPCLCDELSLDGRMLARIADEIGKM